VKSLPFYSAARAALAATLVCGSILPARAQVLPSEPIVLGNGRLTIGGDVSATMSCAHSTGAENPYCAKDAGFFNYTDYDRSTLRMLRLDVTASLQAVRHFSVLGEVRSENAGRPEPYALYVRIRPWMRRNLDIQVGRVPPTFGAFARRTYASDNILIGYPLAYQYLTSLRPDSLPASADELLAMRGRGWLSHFSVGSTTSDHGVPLVSAFRWDTGVQIHAGSQRVDAAAAVTAGTLSNPLVRDDNAGKQVAGRFAFHPSPGLSLGVSAATGPFAARSAVQSVPGLEGSSFTQTAWGADAEYSREYYLIRFETIVSDWRVPIVRAPVLQLPLRALATSVEGRYKINPRFYAAARFDHLGFSEITGTTRRDSWDAPVSRVEIGGGYALQRNVQLKASFQRNDRSGGRVTNVTVGSAQLVFWF
jgi:hypothetical protein